MSKVAGVFVYPTIVAVLVLIMYVGFKLCEMVASTGYSFY